MQQNNRYGQDIPGLRVYMRGTFFRDDIYMVLYLISVTHGSSFLENLRVSYNGKS